jgi:hypothetical protein
MILASGKRNQESPLLVYYLPMRKSFHKRRGGTIGLSAYGSSRCPAPNDYCLEKGV